MRIASFLVVLVLGMLAPTAGLCQQGAAEAPAEERLYLSGDWGGARTTLADHGLEVESVLTFDTIGVVSGGLERGAIGIGDYDLTFTLDTDKAGLWEGGTFFSYFLGIFGQSPLTRVGDIQASDNIDAPAGFKLFEMWYEHAFLEDRVGLLAGLHDYNGDFQVLDSAQTLINSSFGLGADVGQLPPSTFPNAALGLRLRVQPSEESYLLAGVYDGDPRASAHGANFDIRGEDGAFWALEGGLRGGEGMQHYKLAAGTWYRTTNFVDFEENERGHNQGVYVIGEHGLYAESDDPEQGLAGFFQLGFVPESRNVISRYIGAGLTYTGLVDGRDADVLAAGMARADMSGDYRDYDPDIDTAETAFELNYRAQVTPYLALTPDVQWIVHPSGARSIDDALVLLLRLEIAM